MSNIQLKEEHTYRVAKNSAAIAKSLAFENNQRELAEVIGLFHDVGRFKQYSTYKTFNDAKTGSHADIGVDVLRETGILSCLSDVEQELILNAIKYHNLYEIPQKDSPEVILHSKIIRDADKLDGYYIVTNENEERKYSLDKLDTEPSYSQSLIADIINCKNIKFCNMKYENDRKLLMLSLVFDMNFPFSFLQVLNNGYIDKLISKLPKNEEIDNIHVHIKKYIEKRSVEVFS
jgi:putative nucleotidyltransferase with HDIG domain